MFKVSLKSCTLIEAIPFRIIVSPPHNQNRLYYPDIIDLSPPISTAFLYNNAVTWCASVQTLQHTNHLTFASTLIMPVYTFNFFSLILKKPMLSKSNYNQSKGYQMFQLLGGYQA